MKASKLLGSLLLASLASSAAFGLAQGPKEVKIYPAPEKAHAQIDAAIVEAGKTHKRIILDFGGNWCGDCVALDKYFHQEPNASLLKANFILVDVNIGKIDQNKDIAKTFDIPLEKGVPALAVLDSTGKLLFSQKQGEFESMRSLDASSLTDFLNQWKG
jgi:thioredoxin 1